MMQEPSKKSVVLNTCATILTTNDQYWRCDETKAKGIWAGGGATVGKWLGNIQGKIMKDKGCLVGLFALFHFGINSLFLVIRMFSSSCFKECTFPLGNLCPAFRYKGKVREHIVYLLFWTSPLLLKIISVRVAYYLGCHVHLKVIPPRRLGSWCLYPSGFRRDIHSLSLPFCHMYRAKYIPSSEILKEIIAEVKLVGMKTVMPKGTWMGFDSI